MQQNLNTNLFKIRNNANMHSEVKSFYGVNVFNDNTYIIDDTATIFNAHKNHQMDKFIAEQGYIELIPSAFTEEKFSFCDKIRLNDDYFLKKNYF